MQQKPSVGRVVHYVSEGSPVLDDGTQKYESKCRAAIITEVHDVVYPRWAGSEPQEVDEPPVGLCVLNPSGVFFSDSVYDGDTHAGGSWHWPERVS